MTHLIPAVGTHAVAFGLSSELLEAALGKPKAIQTLGDVPGYPSGRRRLDYPACSVLLTRERGVLAITFDAQTQPLMLWGQEIQGMSESELQSHIEAHGHTADLKTQDPWGDAELEALELGLMAWFVEGKLESVELHKPGWRSGP